MIYKVIIYRKIIDREIINLRENILKLYEFLLANRLLDLKKCMELNVFFGV